jgi:hypothetical protein
VRQTDIQTDRQIDRQTDREYLERHTSARRSVIPPLVGANEGKEREWGLRIREREIVRER